MSWENEFSNFKEPFEKFSTLIAKKRLNEKEEHELSEQLNLTALHGWRTLREYMAEEGNTRPEDYEAFENIAKDGFDQDLNSLKDSFENPETPMVNHDKESLREYEWEIREVVYPAFRDLNNFLESKKHNRQHDEKKMPDDQTSGI